VHRSNSSRSALLRLIIFTAVAAAVLGAIAAVPAHSLLSAESPSVAVRTQHGATGEPDSAYYYFPSQFRSPDGPVAEPIATF
jgi:hypothetical protein